MSQPFGRLEYVVIDCNDLPVQIAFWSAALGVDVALREGPYVVLSPPQPGGPGISLQQVPEPKTGKNRLHLDFRVDDVEAATARLLAIGARNLGDLRESGGWFRVMADPEGNEFCLLARQGTMPW